MPSCEHTIIALLVIMLAVCVLYRQPCLVEGFTDSKQQTMLMMGSDGDLVPMDPAAFVKQYVTPEIQAARSAASDALQKAVKTLEQKDSENYKKATAYTDSQKKAADSVAKTYYDDTLDTTKSIQKEMKAAQDDADKKYVVKNQPIAIKAAAGNSLSQSDINNKDKYYLYGSHDGWSVKFDGSSNAKWTIE